MYDVNFIANYIINTTLDKGDYLSNLKLQKLLYFVQASFLVNKGYSCFEDDIEVRDWGVMVEAVHHNHSCSGALLLHRVKRYFKVSPDLFECKWVLYDAKLLKPEDKAIINAVIDKYRDYSAPDLLAITSKQSPVINARYRCGKYIVANEDLVEFFKD